MNIKINAINLLFNVLDVIFYLQTLSNNNKNINLLNISLKKGDTRAFQTIFKKYYARVFAYVNSYTKNESNTKDIVQETFIKLWNNKENMDIDTSISAYLQKIAYNIFIDNYRKDKRKQNLLEELRYVAKYNITEKEADLTSQKIERIKKSIDELPPRCKEIFKLSKYEGLKYVEIATTLNISIKTVEAQMRKAYSYIREQVNVKNI